MLNIIGLEGKLYIARVARLGLFEVKKQIWLLLNWFASKFFENLLGSWPFFKSIEISILKSKFFS